MGPPKKVKLNENADQKTLAAFNFTKTIFHRSEAVEVPIPEVIDSKETYLCCEECNGFFKNKQALSVHVICKHPMGEVNNNKKEANNLIPKSAPRSSDIVNDVLKTVLSAVFTEVLGDENEKSAEKTNIKASSNRRGANYRRSYSASFKFDVIKEVESGEETELSIEAKYKVNRSLVFKWKKDKDKIIKAATGEHKNLLKVRPSVKYMSLFKKLIIKFRDARSKGHRVNFNWLWAHARILYKEETGDSSATVGKHVIVSFVNKHKIKMRRRQRNRKQPKESFRKELQKWHATTRERLVRSGAQEVDYNPKWGYFLPEHRQCLHFGPDFRKKSGSGLF